MRTINTIIEESVDYLLDRIESLAYNHKRREGCIYTARGSRPDMQTCISLFEKALELEVTSIYVIAGKRPQAMYFLGLNGEWHKGTPTMPSET